MVTRYHLFLDRDDRQSLSQIVLYRGEDYIGCVDDDDMDRILHDAREIAGCDPHDDKLPPARAIVEALLDWWREPIDPDGYIVE